VAERATVSARSAKKQGSQKLISPTIYFTNDPFQKPSISEKNHVTATHFANGSLRKEHRSQKLSPQKQGSQKTGG